MEAGDKSVDLRAATGGNLTVNDSGSAITDSVTITNNAAATDIFATNDLIVGGYETVTYSGSGSGAAASQDFGVITITADTGGTTTLNLSGTNAVSTTGAITAGTINASGLSAQVTGTATFTMGAAAVGVTTITGSGGDDTLLGDAASTIDGGGGNDVITGGTGNDTLTGGAGGDTITTNTGNDTVTAGDGDDTVNMDGALSASDVITGGAGTDTLAIDAAATAITAVGVSGFERLRLDTAATQDMTLFTNNSTFDSLDSNGVASVFTNVGLGVTTLHNTASASTASITRLVDTATNSLTVVAQDTTTGSEGATLFATLTANNEETITLTSGSNAAETLTVTTLAASDLTTVVMTGTAAVVVTSAVTGGTAVASVDSTALAGAATFTAANSTVAVTMTAGAGGATFTGGVGADTLTGGAGVNVLDGGAGNDTIVGGASADTAITGGFGADNITGGAGDDNFVQTNLHGVTATAVIDASTGNAMAATVTFAVGDSIVYGNGVDVYTDFTAGGTVDDIDTFVAGAATSLVGVAHDQLNAADDINFLSGSWNQSTLTFTITADGVGADTLIVSIDESVAESIDNTANAFILVGVDSDDLVAADFI
jgi:Ca2+-binding RTX toxin-like protein